MLDRFTSMAAFVRTVETGSFTAAAESLDLSQQMVAKHVAALEKRLGMRLLNRTTRHQGLTAAGKTYYERCKTALAALEAAENVAAENLAEPTGLLRITAPISFGRYVLMPLITDFLQSCRKVDVDLVLTDRIVDLVDEGFEAAFRIGDLPASGLIARPLIPQDFVLVASPAYLAQHGVPSCPADLAGHECLGFGYPARRGHKIWRLEDGVRTQEVEVRTALRVNDSSALLVAALEGFGVLLAPGSVVERELRAGQLVRILPDFHTRSRSVSLVYLADRYQPPKLRRFVEMALSRLA